MSMQGHCAWLLCMFLVSDSGSFACSGRQAEMCDPLKKVLLQVELFVSVLVPLLACHNRISYLYYAGWRGAMNRPCVLANGPVQKEHVRALPTQGSGQVCLSWCPKSGEKLKKTPPPLPYFWAEGMFRGGGWGGCIF